MSTKWKNTDEWSVFSLLKYNNQSEKEKDTPGNRPALPLAHTLRHSRPRSCGQVWGRVLKPADLPRNPLGPWHSTTAFVGLGSGSQAALLFFRYRGHAWLQLAFFSSFGLSVRTLGQAARGCAVHS